MHSISVFLDKTKVTDFRWKKADVKKTQGQTQESSRWDITVSSFIICERFQGGNLFWSITGVGQGDTPAAIQVDRYDKRTTLKKLRTVYQLHKRNE